MLSQKISEIISLAIITAPMAQSVPVVDSKISLAPATSYRSSTRKMQYLLANAPRLEVPQIPDSAIAQFPSFGVLRETADGFVYVDVDDDYIHKLIRFIEDEGFEEPPYFGGTDLVGAHISVMNTREVREGKIEECGQVIHFTPTGCKVVQPPHWKEVEQVYFIEVDAPELDLIRAKYGLPKNEFAFHITVGVKPKHLLNQVD